MPGWSAERRNRDHRQTGSRLGFGSGHKFDASGALLWERREFPFGDTRVDTGAAGTERFFTGQIEDSDASLYYFNARYLEPGIGRFISPDSIVPNPSDPRDYNRYGYVRNNPLKYTDPSGHCSYVGERSDCDYVSGGRAYNLFTNRQIAEAKFKRWLVNRPKPRPERNPGPTESEARRTKRIIGGAADRIGNAALGGERYYEEDVKRFIPVSNYKISITDSTDTNHIENIMKIAEEIRPPDMDFPVMVTRADSFASSHFVLVDQNQVYAGKIGVKVSDLDVNVAQPVSYVPPGHAREMLENNSTLFDPRFIVNWFFIGELPPR